MNEGGWVRFLERRMNQGGRSWTGLTVAIGDVGDKLG